MENAIALKEETPPQVYGVEINQGLEAAKLLKASMNRKAKKIFFNNKEYAEFHDLQVVANYFGHSIRTYEAQPVDINGVKGFKAHADLINKDGIHIGGAEAFCLQDEPNWARKPLFQLASMAQTRAAAKCITNDYRWVLDLAGYGTTPAEEMPTESNPTLNAPTYTPAKQASGELEHATITIKEMKDDLTKNGKVFYRLLDEKAVPYKIFDRPLYELALTLIGADVNISFEKSKFGNTIKDITEAVPF